MRFSRFYLLILEARVGVNVDKRNVRFGGILCIFDLPSKKRNRGWFTASEKSRWGGLAAFAVCGIWFALSEFLCPFICTSVSPILASPARTHHHYYRHPLSPAFILETSEYLTKLFSTSSVLVSFSSPIVISISAYPSFLGCLPDRNAFVFAAGCGAL